MIIVIGDSITYGQHLAEHELAWPRLVTGHELLAFGVPGETTRQGLERFPHDVQSHEPSAVVIQFGHNDCNRWESDRGCPRVTPEAYRANLVEMALRARLFGAVPFFCTLTPSRRSYQHAEDTARYDGILREVVVATDARLIDVRTAFGITEWFLLPDGLHLSAAGHKVYARTVQQALDRWEVPS